VESSLTLLDPAQVDAPKLVQCSGNVNDRRSRLYNPVPLDAKTVDVGSAVEHVVLGKSGLDSGTALFQLRALCPPDCHLLRLVAPVVRPMLV
jgi:hypothetical protein